MDIKISYWDRVFSVSLKFTLSMRFHPELKTTWYKSNMGELRNPGYKSNVSLTQLTEVGIRLIIKPESDLLSLTDWLTHWLTGVPTQNLLRLLLLLMLMIRIVLATVCCRFGSWGLVIKLNFCSDFEQKIWSRFEVEVQAKYWGWSLVGILLPMFGWHYEVESWSRFWS